MTPRTPRAPARLPVPGCTPLRRIGCGTTSTVVLCRRDGCDTPVAVKISNVAATPSAAGRFREEARALTALGRHPHVLALLGSGIADDGRPYLLLEFAPHGSCADLLADGRRLDVDETLALGVAMASALHAAHRLGVVHRDVKPSNILLAADRTPVLADFGIAATVYDANRPTGWSEPWAPPEVTSGMSGGDETADLHALAATMTALLAGAPVRDRSGDGGLLMPDGLPKPVREVLASASNADPDRRFPTALAFARALQRLQVSRGTAVTPIAGVDATPEPIQDPPRDQAPASTERTPRHLPHDGASYRATAAPPAFPAAPVAATVVCALFALAAAAAFALLPDRVPQPAPTPDRSVLRLGPSPSESAGYPQSDSVGPSYPHVDGFGPDTPEDPS